MSATEHRRAWTRRPATFRTVMVVAWVAVVVAACQSADADTPPVDAAAADAVIVADAMEFVDPPTAIANGERILVLHNRDEAPHDLTVDGPLGTFVAAGSERQAAVEVRLEPGVYTMYCSVGGHRDAGMEFKLQVL